MNTQEIRTIRLRRKQISTRKAEKLAEDEVYKVEAALEAAELKAELELKKQQEKDDEAKRKKAAAAKVKREKAAKAKKEKSESEATSTDGATQL